MKISVIIPLYYGEKYIKKLIDIMKCNAKNLPDEYSLEVVFVKDSNENIDFNKYNFENLNVKILENKKNEGIHYSRVRGIKNSSGDYIHMLDQDDQITKDFYKNYIKYINKSDVVVGNGIEERNGYIKFLYKYYIMQSTVKYKFFYTKFSCRIISPGQCIIKKCAIPKVWIDNIIKNSGSDDAMLWLIMLNNKKKFAINRYVGYRHVNTGVNLSLNSSKMSASVMEIIDIMEKTHSLDKKNLKRMKVNLKKNNKSLFVKMIEKINKTKI